MKSGKQIVSYALISVLIWACGRVTQIETPTKTPGVLSTKQITASAEPTELLSVQLTKEDTPLLEPDLAKSDCLAQGGEIEQLTIESEFLGEELRFRVYTPPCYAEQAQRRFPVLYLFHGQSYNDDQWDRLGADEAADKLIASGEIAPFLIVMPYDRVSRQPSKAPFGGAVVEELLPWVDANYRTLAEREGRAIGGLSRGASWALHLGMTHPELFGAMGGHSPPVFVEDSDKVRGWLDGIPEELMPRIWLDIGELDQRRILDSVIWFEGLLDERDIPHEWSLFNGTHVEEYWSSHVELYLRWYAADW